MKNVWLELAKTLSLHGDNLIMFSISRNVDGLWKCFFKFRKSCQTWEYSNKDMNKCLEVAMEHFATDNPDGMKSV